MKNLFKLLAILLVTVILVTSFASCGTTEAPQEQATKDPSDDPIDDSLEYAPDIDKTNYGEEFYLSIMGDVNPPEYYWLEENKDDAMSAAVYERQERVRAHIGVEIVGSRTETVKGYIQPFKTAVKNKDDSVHLLISHVFYGIDGFITGNYIVDFNDIPEINLYAPYWNTDVMEQISINGKQFLGFSDFNILYTHVLSFNKEMLSKYEDQLDESIYDMVENYHWTIDKMMWMASLAYIDNNSDGKTNDDIFGLVGYQSVPFIGFMHASNINLVEQNEKGTYVLSMMNEVNAEKTKLLTEKLKDLSMSQYAFLEYPVGGSWPANRQSVKLSTGRALMQLTSTYSLNGFLSYDIDFGVSWKIIGIKSKGTRGRGDTIFDKAFSKICFCYQRRERSSYQYRGSS